MTPGTREYCWKRCCCGLRRANRGCAQLTQGLWLLNLFIPEWIVSLKSQGFAIAGIAACHAGGWRMSLRKAADNQPHPPAHSELLLSDNMFSFHCITFSL